LVPFVGPLFFGHRPTSSNHTSSGNNAGSNTVVPVVPNLNHQLRGFAFSGSLYHVIIKTTYDVIRKLRPLKRQPRPEVFSFTVFIN